MSKRSVIAPLCLAAALVGCKQPSAPAVRSVAADAPLVGGVGKQLAAGRMTDLRVSPDLQVATYLKDAQNPPVEGISPKLMVGELDAASLATGQVRKLGEGVTNAPGGYLFSPDSRWVVFLEGFNIASQAGEARAVDLTQPEAKPIPLGAAVTYFTFSPDSKSIALVDNGVLKLGPVGGGLQPLGGEISTATFTSDGKYLVFRRKLTAGAALLIARVGQAGKPTQVASGVVGYEVSPDAERIAFTTRDPGHPDIVDLSVLRLGNPRPQPVARESGQFAFSPDGKWLGRTEGSRPHAPGALVVGPASGGPGKKVGEGVQSFQFSPDSKAIAALVRWNDRARVGKLAVATLPDGAVQTLDERAMELAWDPKGRFVAYSAQVLKPIYSIDLFLYRVGAKASRKVGAGVFGWSFGPDDDYLLFRTECLREGRACDLDVLDLAKEAPPEKVLDAVYTFKPSPDAKRLLFTYARMDSETYDAAIFDLATRKRKTLDERTLLPAHFASLDGSRVVYLIGAGDRQGLYLANTAQIQ